MNEFTTAIEVNLTAAYDMPDGCQRKVAVGLVTDHYAPLYYPFEYLQAGTPYGRIEGLYGRTQYMTADGLGRISKGYRTLRGAVKCLREWYGLNDILLPTDKVKCLLPDTVEGNYTVTKVEWVDLGDGDAFWMATAMHDRKKDIGLQMNIKNLMRIN